MKNTTFGIMRLLLSALLLMLINIIFGCQHDQDETDRIRPWPDNQHYLAWGETPVFLLGPAGYHGWTPISRPAEMDFHDQLNRLDRMIREMPSTNRVDGGGECENNSGNLLPEFNFTLL